MQTVVVRDERPQPSSLQPVITAREVVRRYGEGDTAVEALRGVSLDIARGKLTAVMGPSGSGKSTLMHILAGLDRPTEGQVHIEGTDITGLEDTALTKLRRDHIGFIFQFFNLLGSLSAEENVLLPALIARRTEAAIRRRAVELLELVGLGDRAAHTPGELSGGQQQRVSIARALLLEPELVLADEPTGNLDTQAGAEVLGLLRAGADEGRAVVMVTHEAAGAAIADRVLTLRGGRLVE